MFSLTAYTQHTLKHTRTVSPPHLGFLLDSGATPNLLNNETRIEPKEYHNLQLKTLTFVLSAANNTEHSHTELWNLIFTHM